MRVALVGIAITMLASAQDFFPLQTGNTWTYRSADGRETREIHVGKADGVWYPVTGLTSSTILVSKTANGSVVAKDPESGASLPLLQTSGSFSTSIAGCTQLATVADERIGYQGPLGFFNSALQVNFNVSNCKDTGVEEELYLENIGLARRTFQTVAGPRTLDLVAARVGNFTFASDPSSVTRLALEKTTLSRSAHDEPMKLKAQVQVALFQSPSVKVRFETEQRYDFVLKNSQQQVVYRWSEGHFFATQPTEEVIKRERSFPIQVELPINLPDGSYKAEAWLTTADGPQFTAAAPMEVKTVSPSVAMMKTGIQKASAEALPLGI